MEPDGFGFQVSGPGLKVLGLVFQVLRLGHAVASLGFEVLGVCRQDPHLKKAAGLISRAWAILEYKCSTDFNGFGKG